MLGVNAVLLCKHCLRAKKHGEFERKRHPIFIKLSMFVVVYSRTIKYYREWKETTCRGGPVDRCSFVIPSLGAAIVAIPLAHFPN